MGAEEKVPTSIEIERYFEQSPDAISFYCDFTQVIRTGHEVVIQLYETIPSPPDRKGNITKVITRLRATITLNIAHAQQIGQLLVEKATEIKSEVS